MKSSKKFNSIFALFLCISLVLTSVICFPEKVSAVDYSAASDEAYNWLKTMQIPSGNAFAGLVDSFEDTWADGTKVKKEYTYDQALAAIAFLLKGDTTRAIQVLDMLKATQDPAGFWINSYWWDTGYGEELRRHVGPVLWVCLAVMNYEKITGDTATYHAMATKAIDWCLTFQKANGGISGGETTWDQAGVWTEEVWSSTEHNEDAYACLMYFASTTPSKAATYNAALTQVKRFLDNVVWDSSNNRFYGGFKNNTGLVDPFVPMDVNPWGVLSLGLSGTRNYQASISYVENANGNPGTLANPKYVHSLSYNGTTITAYDFDWQSNNAAAPSSSGGGLLGPDIWFEGSAFMSCVYRMMGNDTKADSIIGEIIKKQGKDGSLAGGIPYCLNGTNNNYWLMAQQNCVSSTAWLIIAIAKWNPFTGTSISGGTTTQVSTPTFSPAGGTYSTSQTVSISCATSGATIRYTTDGSTPTASSAVYSSPITVSSTQTIKAYAVKSGLTDSAVATAAYTISSGSSPTTWYLYNTAVSGATPAGQNMQTANSSVTGWQPIKTVNTTAAYWYAPAETKTYAAGTWNFTLWTNSPGASSNIKVDLYKVNANGGSAVLIGSQTKDVNTTGTGNHFSTYTFTTAVATALSNQRLMVKITKTSGADATMAYNTNDFATRLVTP